MIDYQDYAVITERTGRRSVIGYEVKTSERALKFFPSSRVGWREARRSAREFADAYNSGERQ